jgi:hypothetical protein
MMDSFFRSSSSRSHRPYLSDSNNENVINNKENRVMRDFEIMMKIRDELNRNYEINKDKLRKDFMSPEYDDKRKWFFNTFSQLEQNNIITIWYNHMNELRTDIYFFPWFEYNYEKINIRKDNNTDKIENSQTNEEYSPSKSTTLTHLETQIIVSPLKVTSFNDENKDMNNVIQQSNNDKEISPCPLPNEIIHKEYTPNESLSFIHKESQLVTPPLKLITYFKEASPSNNNNIILQNDFKNTCIKAFIDKTNKIENQINSLKIKNQEKETERLLLYETPLNLQFSFKINNAKLLIHKNPDQENKNHVSTSNHSKILKNLQEDSETELDTELVNDKLQSKDLDLNRMILENKNGRGIILRNNYKKKNVTHTSIIHNWYPEPPDIQFEELGIKTKLRNTYIANALHNWNIDNLSDYKISDILHDIIIANTYKCPNKSDHQILNIISNQSIKDVLRYKKNIYKNLKHLKYLSKRYKDVFLPEILIRMNKRNSNWKERFIEYFTHKVKEKFNNCHNDYMSLTYRKIINALKHIELNLCIIYDLRLTNHFKDKKYDKKELGSFYQNGFLNCFISLIVSFIKYKFHKKKIRSYKPYKTKSSKTLHYKFGQISHYNNCKIKDKIIKLNIRFQLLNILFE